MAETPLADRVTTLETKMEQVNFFIAQFDKVLEVRFRAQAEMLDERFAQVFTVMDRRFVDVLRQIDSRFVDVVEEMREGIATILQRLS
jgi:hypothetical protein